MSGTEETAPLSAAALVRTALAALDQLSTLAEALDRFVGTWTDSGLAYELVSDYQCTLTCEEADSLADLLTAYGDTEGAQLILSEHAAYDECGHAHHTCPDCTGPHEQPDASDGPASQTT